MKITTILVDEIPKAVVKPVDNKDLRRFLKNGNAYLTVGNTEAKVSHRDADDMESDRWLLAFQLHKAWGGDEDGFFGVPL
ncbi:MAG: hypothetical protein CTY29_08640 [Methylobacter sp.]|nr:MAG: hypothetical protein CTY29_08640 [Methylobacter sp.]PPD23470.1 MAG: hypothetical protein CTY24_04195 [Methylobacter sp.]